jgi:anti-sigma factor RsiW
MIVTCRKLTELITDQKEGKLSAVQQAGYSLHLLWCRHCRAYVEQMSLTVEAVKDLPSEPVPGEVHEALLAAFRKRHGG